MGKKENYIFPGIMLIAAAIWFVFYLLNPDHLKYLDVLFAAFSFLGVMWAIVVQKAELKLQRRELKLQRKELESTRKVFIEQSSTSRKQRFENSFFQLLNVHVERERSLSYKGKVGGEAFTIFVTTLSSGWQGSSGLLEREKFKEYEERINKEYATKRGESDLNRFIIHFNNAFLIMDFIKKSNLVDDNEKAFYFNILKSQLSQNEFYLLNLESQYREGFGHVDFFKDATHPNIPKIQPPAVGFGFKL